MKKKFLFFFLLLNSPIFANSLIESKFNVEKKFNGLAVNIKSGYFYRNNDFSIFPYLGLEINANDYLLLENFAGCSIIYKQFTWDNKFSYELLPSLLDNNYDIFYGQSIPGYSFDYIKFKLPFSIGYHNYLSSNGLRLKREFFNIALECSIFLFDFGWIKSTLNTKESFTSIFKSKFNYYDFSVFFPITISTTFAEFGFYYSFNYRNDIKLNNSREIIDISIPYSKLTGRIFFNGNVEKYKHIHSFETETRWYFLRHFNKISSLFISIFGNCGFASNNNGCDFLFEYGIGAGYNFIDNVPLTIQVGFNQDKRFLLYFCIAAPVSHSF